jgi:hypothetical protein
MKKLIAFTLFLLLFGGILIITNCKKDNPPTALQITVTDNLGSPSVGATATLYPSQSDLNNKTNPVSSNVTDASGKVTFTNLAAQQYYWFIENSCLNNANGAETTSALTPNVTTTTTTVLSQTGTLKYVNNSTDPYQVFINGTLRFTAAGGQSYIDNYIPVGSYTIRVLQVSGYAVYPTDESFTGTLSCGATLTTTFP